MPPKPWPAMRKVGPSFLLATAAFSMPLLRPALALHSSHAATMNRVTPAEQWQRHPISRSQKLVFWACRCPASEALTRGAAQALLADLARSPAGRLRGAQGSPLMMESFLESVEEQPLASASIAQVALPALRPLKNPKPQITLKLQNPARLAGRAAAGVFPGERRGAAPALRLHCPGRAPSAENPEETLENPETPRNPKRHRTLCAQTATQPYASQHPRQFPCQGVGSTQLLLCEGRTTGARQAASTAWMTPQPLACILLSYQIWEEQPKLSCQEVHMAPTLLDLVVTIFMSEP